MNVSNQVIDELKKCAELLSDLAKHLPGQHDQMSHGHGRGGRKPTSPAKPESKPSSLPTPSALMQEIMSQFPKPESKPTPKPKPTSKPKPASKPMPETQQVSNPAVQELVQRRTYRREVDDEEIRKRASDAAKNRKLNPKETQAINRYTTSVGAAEANEALRSGIPIEKVPPPGYAQHVQNAASQKLPEPQLVYRGLSGPIANQLKKMKPGDSIQAEGFVSTSFDPSIAVGFAGRKGAVMEIKAKTGVYISDKSQYPDEVELVQAHGSKYRFVGVEKRAEVGYTRTDVYMFEEV